MPALLAVLVFVAMAACAHEQVPPRVEVAYPEAPRQQVVGTAYAATPGLPLPPRTEAGIVPAPPPRYLGESASASSANVGGVAEASKVGR